MTRQILSDTPLRRMDFTNALREMIIRLNANFAELGTTHATAVQVIPSGPLLTMDPEQALRQVVSIGNVNLAALSAAAEVDVASLWLSPLSDHAASLSLIMVVSDAAFATLYAAEGGEPEPEPEVFTWNPLDKSTNVALSNGNLTATMVGGGYTGVRATVGHTTGKWHFELTLGTDDDEPDIGLGKATAALDNFVGIGPDSVGMYSEDTFYINDTQLGAAPAFTTGSVVAVEIDLDERLIRAAVDGAAWVDDVDISSLSAGELFPMFSSFGASVATINLGASEFTKTVSEGFTAWDGGDERGPYVAQAVNFDGATWLINAAFVSTDTAQVLMSVWTKNPLTVADLHTIFVVNPDYVNWAAVSTMDELSPHVKCSAGSSSDYVDGIASDVSRDVWHHTLWCAKTDYAAGLKKFAIYIDDDPNATVGDDEAGSLVPTFNGFELWVGHDSYAGDEFRGDMADLRIMTNANVMQEDGTLLEATRRLFISADGKPVDPAVATAALGAPAVLLSGNAASFATNQGAGGAFAVTGTLTDASTSPSE